MPMTAWRDASESTQEEEDKVKEGGAPGSQCMVQVKAIPDGEPPTWQYT